MVRIRRRSSAMACNSYLILFYIVYVVLGIDIDSY